MKTARWIVAFFLAISLIFTFCACKKDDKKEDEKETAYSVEIKSCRIKMEDSYYYDTTYLQCYFDVVYTNLGDESSSFYEEDLEFYAYYNGVELESAFGGTGYDEKEKKVKPDASVTIKMIFELDMRDLVNDCEILEVEIKKGKKVVERKTFNMIDCFDDSSY